VNFIESFVFHLSEKNKKLAQLFKEACFGSEADETIKKMKANDVNVSRKCWYANIQDFFSYVGKDDTDWNMTIEHLYKNYNFKKVLPKILNL